VGLWLPDITVLKGAIERLVADNASVQDAERQIRYVSLFWLKYRHPDGRFAGADSVSPDRPARRN
jgi:hypothetical protein